MDPVLAIGDQDMILVAIQLLLVNKMYIIFVKV